MICFSFLGIKDIDSGRILHFWNNKIYKKSKIFPSLPLNEGKNFCLHQKYWICDICGKKFTREEYKNSWNWGGPHCPDPKCNNGGIKLFARKEGPIICGRNFLNKFE